MRLTPDEIDEMNAALEKAMSESAARMRETGLPEWWIAKPDTRRCDFTPRQATKRIFTTDRSRFTSQNKK